MHKMLVSEPSLTELIAWPQSRGGPFRAKLRRTQSEYMFSALPPNSDIARHSRHVSKVPEADSCSATRRYSITSSARASNEGGTVRPSALAVLRLITSSYLVGCSIGRSDGFVPLRILPT